MDAVDEDTSSASTVLDVIFRDSSSSVDAGVARGRARGSVARRGGAHGRVRSRDVLDATRGRASGVARANVNDRDMVDVASRCEDGDDGRSVSTRTLVLGF